MTLKRFFLGTLCGMPLCWVLSAGLLVATLIGGFIAFGHRLPKSGGHPSEAGTELPFSIESRPAHPFPACQIVFPDGKTVPIFLSDLPSGVDYGVYQLANGDFYLQGESEQWFSWRYRIRPADRAVDLLGGPCCDDTESPLTWLEIPPDIVCIIDADSQGIFCECTSSPEAIVTDVATPVGDTLDNLRRIGSLSPDGLFTPSS